MTEFKNRKMQYEKGEFCGVDTWLYMDFKGNAPQCKSRSLLYNIDHVWVKLSVLHCDPNVKTCQNRRNWDCVNPQPIKNAILRGKYSY